MLCACTPSQNLICSVNDELVAPNTKYIVLDLLGQGTFGQVQLLTSPFVTVTDHSVNVTEVKAHLFPRTLGEHR